MQVAAEANLQGRWKEIRLSEVPCATITVVNLGTGTPGKGQAVAVHWQSPVVARNSLHFQCKSLGQGRGKGIVGRCTVTSDSASRKLERGRG